MVKYRVAEVKLAWRDFGQSIWQVTVTRTTDKLQGTLRVWAIDELDAYKKALEKLEEQTNDHRL